MMGQTNSVQLPDTRPERLQMQHQSGGSLQPRSCRAARQTCGAQCCCDSQRSQAALQQIWPCVQRPGQSSCAQTSVLWTSVPATPSLSLAQATSLQRSRVCLSARSYNMYSMLVAWYVRQAHSGLFERNSTAY